MQNTLDVVMAIAPYVLHRSCLIGASSLILRRQISEIRFVYVEGESSVVADEDVL